MTKIGAAYLAASFLTTTHLADVADDYLDWIDAQVGSDDRAVDALLAACRSSKSPAKVLAQAAVYYADFADGVPENEGDGNDPVIADIVPATDVAAGGEEITITGLNLTGAAVLFDAAAGTAEDVNEDGTSMTVIAPAHAAGVVNVTVTTADGTDVAVGGFTYTA